jgi:hypothetical protein
MALETRPFPVLTGKAARDFWKKVDNFQITETPEQIKEINRKVRASIERSRKLGYL